MEENKGKVKWWILLLLTAGLLLVTIVHCRQLLASCPQMKLALALIGCGSVATLCVFMIVLLLLHRLGRDYRKQRELANIQKKNEAMDQLNQRKQQLIHQQRLEIMGTLTSSIAHEFNNLLSPIMGYSMMVLEKLPEEQTDVYDDVLEIYQTSLKAKKLIQQLSDLSRKNSETVFRPISPVELIEKVLRVAKPAQPKVVEVKTELNCADVTFLGNEMQLSQMFLNLVLNAFHEMEQKGGVLTIAAKVQENDILFSVSDTGGGIAPEIIPYIFEPFFTTKEAGKGTGLGLAIVSQVIEDHKGDIDVESRLGVGTTFYIKLPLPS